MNKNLMFRASACNRNTELVTEGKFYSKFRFYSTDDLNSHFRLFFLEDIALITLTFIKSKLKLWDTIPVLKLDL
jgi:hypothetical protein